MFACSELQMNVLGIIPARGGSQGLLRKNLAVLSGRPLINYTIRAAADSKAIDRLVVSSDSGEIISHCRALDVEVLERPANLAQADSPTAPTITHALKSLRADDGYRPDWVILLQPTSPLRSACDIDSAFDLLDGSNADGVISVYEPGHTPYKALVVDQNGMLKGLVSDSAPFMRRQDCPKTFCPNGAIYIFRAIDFMTSGRITLVNTIPYVMPAESSIDIDNELDLRMAEAILAMDAA